MLFRFQISNSLLCCLYLWIRFCRIKLFFWKTFEYHWWIFDAWLKIDSLCLCPVDLKDLDKDWFVTKPWGIVCCYYINYSRWSNLLSLFCFVCLYSDRMPAISLIMFLYVCFHFHLLAVKGFWNPHSSAHLILNIGQK